MILAPAALGGMLNGPRRRYVEGLPVRSRVSQCIFGKRMKSSRGSVGIGDRWSSAVSLLLQFCLRPLIPCVSMADWPDQSPFRPSITLKASCFNYSFRMRLYRLAPNGRSPHASCMSFVSRERLLLGERFGSVTSARGRSVAI